MNKITLHLSYSTIHSRWSESQCQKFFNSFKCDFHHYIYIYMYIYIYIKLHWPTVGEGDPKGPFQ